MDTEALNKLQQDVDTMRQDMQEMKSLLRQLLYPANALSIREKADAINRARATGDRKLLRETIRQINGE